MPVHAVSGPLLDRIDIHIEVPAVQYRELRAGQASEGSAEIRARVLAARVRQHERFQNEAIYSNAQMTTRQIRQWCELPLFCFSPSWRPGHLRRTWSPGPIRHRPSA